MALWALPPLETYPAHVAALCHGQTAAETFGCLVATAMIQPEHQASSPRVRGTLRRNVRPQHSQRFIPACAGNTWTGLDSNQESHGSSPRVRGTLFRGLILRFLSRFIPACAGNTLTHLNVSKIPSVHPRVCGEHKGPGTVLPHDVRFIPACAGNTLPGTIWF